MGTDLKHFSKSFQSELNFNSKLNKNKSDLRISIQLDSSIGWNSIWMNPKSTEETFLNQPNSYDFSKVSERIRYLSKAFFQSTWIRSSARNLNWMSPKSIQIFLSSGLISAIHLKSIWSNSTAIKSTFSICLSFRTNPAIIQNSFSNQMNPRSISKTVLKQFDPTVPSEVNPNEFGINPKHFFNPPESVRSLKK